MKRSLFPKINHSNRVFIFFAIVFTSSMTTSAHAYLDPGTGSMILQGIIASIAVGLGFFWTFWYKVKLFFGFEKLDDQDQNGKLDNE